MLKRRVPLFGFEIDPLTQSEAVEQMLCWVRNPPPVCRYVVTPNLDHAVMLQRNADLRAAYWGASLVLADGWPLVAAARWFRRPLTERVPGSDLVPALFEHAHQRAEVDGRALRVFLLGAAPGVAERAAGNIVARWPSVEIVGTDSPPLGFEHDPAENARILAEIAAVRPDVLVVGLGAPKQELWVHAHREALNAAVALCVGATIDFLAEEKRRAPKWMRRTGLEWLHRMASEPRRLARRYLRDAVAFPGLLMRELIQLRPTGSRAVQ